jgi:hypothetical protein
MPDLSGLASAEQIEQLEDLAFNGAEMPKGLHFPEQLLFLRFRFLYAYAAQIHMDPAQGKREKDEILTEYMGNLTNHILYLGCNEMWKNVEAAGAAIRKDPALYNNDKVRALMVAIYGNAERKEAKPT